MCVKCMQTDVITLVQMQCSHALYSVCVTRSKRKTLQLTLVLDMLHF